MEEERYTLIIAEKPDAAQRIAEALSADGPSVKRVEGGLSYFESRRDGKRIVLVPASGHLYTVTHERGGRYYYPVFNFRWVPKHLAEKGAARTKKMISLIRRLSEGAAELINAADYDIEGSLIGYTILKYACNGREGEAKRMKFSTLTREELSRAYESLMPRLDFELAEAGQTRHEVDWLYGVNLTRALTLSAMKPSAKYRTLSIGRVQGPTLKLIVDREAEIRSFVPSPYWEIYAEVDIRGQTYRVEFEGGRLESEAKAAEVERRCSGKLGEVAGVEEKEVRRAPPEPFDLGALQKEAYRFFSYTPRRTLDIAERLYLDALISYPRTSSQKLPPTLNYAGILEELARNAKYRRHAEALLEQRELRPAEGKKQDPAHPAIYPTGKPPERELRDDEAKIYDLVVRRFLAAFGRPSVRLSSRLTIACEGYRFFLHGRRVVEAGWAEFYKPYVEAEEVFLPSLSVGERIALTKVQSIRRYTEPPSHYNPASLLKAMEENNLGTKATRAEIIETLYARGYIRGERIVATDVGFRVVETLQKYCPQILSIELTREIEDKMERIERGAEFREGTLNEAVELLMSTLLQLKSREQEIGEELSRAVSAELMRSRIVGPCPQCGSGQLMLIRSKRTGKQFIGCSNFFQKACSRSFPLPQKARVIPTEKTCKACGYPVVLVRRLNRRPFSACINLECPTKNRNPAPPGLGGGSP